MTIYRGTTPLKAYRGDMQPVNVYMGSTKIAGWHAASYSGTSPLTVDCDYNVPTDALTVDGKCSQVQSCWGTNLVTDGDFSNGTTRWSPSLATNNVASAKILSIYAETSMSEHYSEQVVASIPIVGHKYYGCAYCEPVVGKFRFFLINRKADGQYDYSWSPIISSAALVSVIITPTSIYSTPIFLFRFNLINSEDKTIFAGTTEETKVSYACLIDLTAAFGAGKEPTAAQMDAIMAAFPNSWFNGSAQLSTDITTYTPNSPSPSFPAPISTITGDVGITGTDGAASNTATIAFGSAVCASLPDGTHDSYDAVTGVLTKRVGKVVFDGSEDESWTHNTNWDQSAPTVFHVYVNIPSWSIGQTSVMNDSFGSFYYTNGGGYVAQECLYCNIVNTSLYIFISASRLASYDVAGFKTWLAANTVTIYYKLATPTTIQLTPHLPVVRTGIKTLTVGADVVPTLSATVKSME